MKTDVYALRFDEQTQKALAAAAGHKKIRPRTLAQLMIVSELQRQGYLPKQTRRAQAARA